LETIPASSVNSLDIGANGKFFVAAGTDKKLKLIDYEEGVTVFTGSDNSSEITQVKITPDQSKIVTVGVDGSIFIWKIPSL
jgi:WD40 repeat protein